MEYTPKARSKYLESFASTRNRLKPCKFLVDASPGSGVLSILITSHKEGINL